MPLHQLLVVQLQLPVRVCGKPRKSNDAKKEISSVKIKLVTRLQQTYRPIVFFSNLLVISRRLKLCSIHEIHLWFIKLASVCRPSVVSSSPRLLPSRRSLLDVPESKKAHSKQETQENMLKCPGYGNSIKHMPLPLIFCHPLQSISSFKKRKRLACFAFSASLIAYLVSALAWITCEICSCQTSHRRWTLSQKVAIFFTHSFQLCYTNSEHCIRFGTSWAFSVVSQIFLSSFWNFFSAFTWNSFLRQRKLFAEAHWKTDFFKNDEKNNDPCVFLFKKLDITMFFSDSPQLRRNRNKWKQMHTKLNPSASEYCRYCWHLTFGPSFDFCFMSVFSLLLSYRESFASFDPNSPKPIGPASKSVESLPMCWSLPEAWGAEAWWETEYMSNKKVQSGIIPCQTLKQDHPSRKLV